MFKIVRGLFVKKLLPCTCSFILPMIRVHCCSLSASSSRFETRVKLFCVPSLQATNPQVLGIGTISTTSNCLENELHTKNGRNDHIFIGPNDRAQRPLGPGKLPTPRPACPAVRCSDWFGVRCATRRPALRRRTATPVHCFVTWPTILFVPFGVIHAWPLQF